MLKKLILLAVLLMGSLAWAQSTSVTLQVTDTPDSQAWNNGTWSATLASPAGSQPFGPPFNFLSSFGGGTVPNQRQSGTLSATGGASITLSDNTAIAPSGSKWLFAVCPQATATCYSQAVTISGGSQSVTLNPPSVRIAGNALPLAYLDVEISNPTPGAMYYHVTSNTVRQWNG